MGGYEIDSRQKKVENRPTSILSNAGGAADSVQRDQRSSKELRAEGWHG